MIEKPVEVLAVQKIYNPSTKEELSQIQFGEFVHPENAEAPVGGVVSLVLNMKFSEYPPYKVGSKWALQVSEETGEVKVTPLMQPKN
jgi:hypothetical protein